MSLRRAEEQGSGKTHLPTDINWDMLDKSKFFILGAGLFSGVSFILYPVLVLKTRQQISSSNSQLSSFKTTGSIIRCEGFFKGFYRGFGTSLMGTIPARALYMTALEVTKSKAGPFVRKMGVSEGTAMASANAIAGLTAATAAQLVWTPIDVVSQRLMVQGSCGGGGGGGGGGGINKNPSFQYTCGVDAFRKIAKSDGIRGLYRGFGMSTVTYAPSNAIWWALYSVSQRIMWRGYSCYFGKKEDGLDRCSTRRCISPGSKTVMGVQGLSAAMAGGFSALVTMPLDTIKTRLQVLDGTRQPTIRQTVGNLVKEGGWCACYRGLGPRWVSSSFSATTMITTYELLKRLSAKNHETM